LNTEGSVAARSVERSQLAFRDREPPDVLVWMGDSENAAVGDEVLHQLHQQAPACALIVVDDPSLPAPGPVKALAAQVREAACSAISEAPRENPRIKGLLGTSPAFARQVARIPVMSACDASVLILGETGTGKELCAQGIHYLSERAGKPWVAVNCGAIPTELLEDEFFGHVRGAYTTAHSTRQGLVREAEGGTLFLDEVDSLSLGAQAKFLRFLQEKEYRPVGSDKSRHADVRIIAASNQNLRRMVEQKRFRQDVFFRLNVLRLHLPPLRERKEDLPILAQEFLRQSALKWKRRVTRLSAAAMCALMRYDWPGNVRELQHVIERAVLLTSGKELLAEELEFDDDSAASADPTAETFCRAKARVVEEFELAYIERLLQAHGGNITHAARAANKNRRAFWQLIRKHHIDPSRFRVGEIDFPR
jgi:two-component system response regulator GlrR